MNEENDFYTETMANVYAEQGYVEKAAEIYRYLLEREPNRQDLAVKFLEMEKRMGDKKNTGSEKLVPLFSQWIDLLLKQNQLKKLKKVSKTVSNIPELSSNQ